MGTRERRRVCLSTRRGGEGEQKKCPGSPTMSEKCEGLCYQGKLHPF